MSSCAPPSIERMRRVLIVSPHFPPVNAPDMQRVRLALPHLRACGWEPVVLAVVPEMVEGAVLDPLLEKTYPADISVVRVRGVSPRLTRAFRFGSLWLRCGAALRRAGERLLREERFDLVFFSTTQFDAFSLGPRWRARFGVPYVLDYQDPWVNDHYRRTGLRPPGGALKFWLSQFTARRREPAALRDAARIVSVSAAYGPELRTRHRELASDAVLHIPFGAEPGDLEIARSLPPPSYPLVPEDDGNRHYVYVGRCGDDMVPALTLLFRAFRLYREAAPAAAARMRFHFLGTDYAPPPLARPRALPVAEREGVADHVSEHPRRIPYFEALRYLARADALVLVGSDDPGYSASKTFPYLFARRPLLTLAHEGSLMLELARSRGIATSYGFSADRNRNDPIASRVHREWFADGGDRTLPSSDLSALSDHTAAAMARRLSTVFDQVRTTATP